MDKFEQLKKVFCQVFKLNPKKFTMKLSTDTLNKWDSLGHLHLISAIEQEFDVKFSTDEILKLKSVNLIQKALQKKIK